MQNAILKDLNSTAQAKLRSFNYSFVQIILDLSPDEYERDSWEHVSEDSHSS